MNFFLFSEFIYSHFGDDSAFNSDDKAALRYKFYDLAAYLVNNKEWNVRALEDALDAVIELVFESSFMFEFSVCTDVEVF